MDAIHWPGGVGRFPVKCPERANYTYNIGTFFKLAVMWTNF